MPKLWTYGKLPQLEVVFGEYMAPNVCSIAVIITFRLVMAD